MQLLAAGLLFAAAATGEPQHAQGLRRGAFTAPDGAPFVAVEPVGDGRVTVSVFARRDAKLPSCISAPQKPDAKRFDCFTPLFDCVHHVELSGGANGLTLRVDRPSGTECYEPWGARTVRLEPDDFPDLGMSTLGSSWEFAAKLPRGRSASWFGTYTDPHPAVGAVVPVLEVESTVEGLTLVTLGLAPRLGNISACVARAAQGATIVTCDACARRLGLTFTGNQVFVRLLGASWREPCSNGRAAAWKDLHDQAYVLNLARVDVLKMIPTRYARGLAQGDVKTVDDRSLYGALGPEPVRAADGLARLVREAYVRAGLDLEELSLSAAWELMLVTEATLLARCAGLPGGSTPARCDQRRLDSAADEAIQSSDWTRGAPRSNGRSGPLPHQ